MMMTIHHGHRLLSHAKLGMQSRNLGLYPTPCSNLEPPLVVEYKVKYVQLRWYLCRLRYNYVNRN